MNRKQYSQSVQYQMSKLGQVYSQIFIMVYIYVQSGDYSQLQYIMNSSLLFIMLEKTNCHL